MIKAKTDCFAYKPLTGTCEALNGLYCCNGNCSFYKSIKQYEIDREKAEETFYEHTGMTIEEWERSRCNHQ